MVGEIALGLTHEHGIDIFTSVFPDFNHRYPGVTFNLLERMVSDQHNFLLGGHLDFGIIMLADSDKIDLEYIKLYNENLVLGIPKTIQWPNTPPLPENRCPPLTCAFSGRTASP